MSFTVRPGGQDLVLAHFGGDHARELEAQGGRVFFAGDACTVDTFGAIYGAWASAAGAARNVAAALRGAG